MAVASHVHKAVPKTVQAPISVDDIENAPPRLPASLDTDWEARYHVLYDKFTTVSDEKFLIQEEYEALKVRRSTVALLDTLIKPYAMRTFIFMCVYCAFAGFILMLSGFGWLRFTLPESVQQLLIGSTATTVIGLVGMVLTGVFVGARKG